MGIFFHLLKNPLVLTKLVAEIDNFETEGRLSKPTKFTETQTMPYLQAVIKEAMRVHPSVAAVYPRYVPAGGITLAGQYLPAGVSGLFYQMCGHAKADAYNHNRLRSE